MLFGDLNAPKLWDVATGRSRTSPRSHVKPFPVALSRMGALFGDVDSTLKLWDVATGKELRTFSGHNDPVRSVAFSPDSITALSGSDDKTLKLWDLTLGH